MSYQKRKPKYLKEKPKGSPVGKIILVLILALLVTGGVLAWKYVVKNIKSEIMIEVGESVTAEDFLIRDWKLPVQLETELSDTDLSVPGEYPVSIRYCWLSHESTVRVRDTVPPVGEVQHLTVFSNQIPGAADFVTSITDLTDVTVSFAQEPDVTLEGDQTVTIVLTDMGGNTSKYAAILTILFDETAPEITGAEDRYLFLGHDADLLSLVQVTDDLDEAPVLTVDDGGFDPNVEGEYTVTYTAVDASGNETKVSATFTVIKDEQAPELLGVRPLSVFAGGTIAYRSNVIVTDDIDTAPTLTVDSSQVDLSTPGEYKVVYTATDGAGNSASMETTVTVGEKPSNYVEESVIYEAADERIAKIIRDDMTTKQKVQAVYKWVMGECWYDNNTDKTDWMQAAYRMLNEGCGDCFGYYAVSRLLFDRLGIPNLTVQRLGTAKRSTTHYWNMVSIDGGETYYHFDSCPHPKPYMDTCLFTDAELEWYNQRVVDYYLYDKSLYPATPEE